MSGSWNETIATLSDFSGSAALISSSFSQPISPTQSVSSALDSSIPPFRTTPYAPWPGPVSTSNGSSVSSPNVPVSSVTEDSQSATPGGLLDTPTPEITTTSVPLFRTTPYAPVTWPIPTTDGSSGSSANVPASSSTKGSQSAMPGGLLSTPTPGITTAINDPPGTAVGPAQSNEQFPTTTMASLSIPAAVQSSILAQQTFQIITEVGTILTTLYPVWIPQDLWPTPEDRNAILAMPTMISGTPTLVCPLLFEGDITALPCPSPPPSTDVPLIFPHVSGGDGHDDDGDGDSNDDDDGSGSCVHGVSLNFRIGPLNLNFGCRRFGGRFGLPSLVIGGGPPHVPPSGNPPPEEHSGPDQATMSITSFTSTATSDPQSTETQSTCDPAYDARCRKPCDFDSEGDGDPNVRDDDEYDAEPEIITSDATSITSAYSSAAPTTILESTLTTSTMKPSDSIDPLTKRCGKTQLLKSCGMCRSGLPLYSGCELRGYLPALCSCPAPCDHIKCEWHFAHLADSD
jgi:hypothetical protein